MFIKGRAWTFGRNVNTDLIFPKMWFRPTYEPGEMASHLMVGIDADFPSKVARGDIIVGGIDLAPATIDGLKSGYVSVTLDQLLYLQGFMPVLQCVLSKKYLMPGIALNTGAGVVTPSSIDKLVPLIEAGIR